MLAYLLDTSICIDVTKTYPPALRKKFNALAERLSISSITLGGLRCDPFSSMKAACIEGLASKKNAKTDASQVVTLDGSTIFAANRRVERPAP